MNEAMKLNSDEDQKPKQKRRKPDLPMCSNEPLTTLLAHYSAAELAKIWGKSRSGVLEWAKGDQMPFYVSLLCELQERRHKDFEKKSAYLAMVSIPEADRDKVLSILDTMGCRATMLPDGFLGLS